MSSETTNQTTSLSINSTTNLITKCHIIGVLDDGVVSLGGTAQAHLAQAECQLLAGNAELAAEELRQAQLGLGQITGQLDADGLLGRIFSGFCIGK